MNKVLVVILVSLFWVFSALSSVDACQDYRCYAETPDFSIETLNNVSVEVLEIEGRTQLKGCRSDGMFEVTNLDILGSSVNVGTAQNIEVSSNRALCRSCTTISASGVQKAGYVGYVGITGHLNGGLGDNITVQSHGIIGTKSVIKWEANN